VKPWADENEGKKAILLDNASAHFSPELLDRCKENDIMFIPLIANSTHLTQPCDVAVFKSIKLHWQLAVQQFNESRRERNMSTFEHLPKTHFTTVLDKMFSMVKDPGALIRNAFRKSGLFPFRPEVLLEGMC
jgi:hypothetical protein